VSKGLEPLVSSEVCAAEKRKKSGEAVVKPYCGADRRGRPEVVISFYWIAGKGTREYDLEYCNRISGIRVLRGRNRAILRAPSNA